MDRTHFPAFARAAYRKARESGAWHDWRWQHQNRLTSVAEIVRVLGEQFSLHPTVLAGMQQASADYPVAVTPYYLSLVDLGDPRDPVLPQILPDPDEVVADGTPDPFAEQELFIAPGVVHRYPDRALLLLTNFCATLCRHCMRKREWQKRFQRLTDSQIEAAVAAIAARPQIRDVLISGGDPLNLGAGIVSRVLGLLRERTDLDCLRFGSRVPVTQPQRIDDEMLRALEPHAPLFLNTHFNHARELTPEAVAAVQRLTQVGVVVSNQAVLLRAVNDREQDLLDLSRALLRAGVRAYYLHHCDPVQGVRHLRVGLPRALKLVRSLSGQVSGLAIPRFMVDLPGGEGKVVADGPSLLRVEGETFVYQSPLSGAQVAVEGSEGGFRGVGSWRGVVSAQEGRYVATR